MPKFIGSEILSKNNATGFINIIHSSSNNIVFVNKIGETKNKNCIRLVIIIWTSLNLVPNIESEIQIGNKKISNNKNEKRDIKKNIILKSE